MKRPIQAPLYEALMQHFEDRPLSFHVPGHKFGRGISEEYLSTYRGILEIDVTELSDTDNLHQPVGVIQEAQSMAAAYFGAEDTYFLVGGSTSGNMTMILSVCEPGELILVQRNVHKSVLNGLALAGARAVFVTSREQYTSVISTIPDLNDMKEALQRYPEAKAIFVSNPNYYGAAADLTHVADLAHQHGIPLLVDEAHGAHYGLHPNLPVSALCCGADAVVQSTHKTLTAMTMGAMLHIQGNLINRNAVKHSLSMIQSSSPSYPIMASLDITRAMAEKEGESIFDTALAAADHFQTIMYSKVNSFVMLNSRHYNHYKGITLDPLRAVVWDSTGTLSGYTLSKELEQRGCWAEMADPLCVVLVFGISTTISDVESLAAAFAEIEVKFHLLDKESVEQLIQKPMKHPDLDPVSSPVSLRRTIPQENETETVSLQMSFSRMSAELVVPYPPGIPVLYPGELITEPVMDLLLNLSKHGAVCQGLSDPTLRTLKVFI